jgi:hypothetical protein
MPKTEQATVDEWLTVLSIACDPESPFAGQVDLTDIFKLPLAVQRQIYDRLAPNQIELIKKFYGPKEESDAKD